MKKTGRYNRIIRWMRYGLCGVLIGAGAILPGVSGGVLAVVFDIYRPVMEVLTHPRTSLPKHWHIFPPLGMGWVLGFLLFAKGISAALAVSDTVTTWLFIGLIAGTIPSLFREAGKEGRSISSWASFAFCAVVLFGGLSYLSNVLQITVRPNFWWYNVCGALWGMSVIIPGLTSSSIMMALGLYQPMMDGLACMDLRVLCATLPGMFLAILLLSRFVNWFLEQHYAAAFHGILGIVLASTLVIIPSGYTSSGEIILSAICCIIGFLLAFLLARLDQKAKG